jgi:spore germination cell wall hydrolase CwlJ-like protein
MSLFGKRLAAALGVAALSGTFMVPVASALQADPAPQPQIAATPAPQPAILPQAETSPSPLAESSETAAPQPARTAGGQVDAELGCLARVVLHEAGNQSRTGQLAVAQVVMNRVHSGRFAGTICGVMRQRGQFNNISGFNPRHDARWRLALDVAREARDGLSAPVVGNALFFRAVYSAGSFRNRTRVSQIGAHIFYR